MAAPDHGQVTSLNAAAYRQRFTPRRARSLWSARNVGHVERLVSEGRMRPAGLAAVAAAKADGRWEAAYADPATMTVPAELAEALDATPDARRAFEELDASTRYSMLHSVTTAKRPETRARRAQAFAELLARGAAPRSP